jgi:hypothetical protein
MKSAKLKPLLPELFILGSLFYYWIASSWLNPIALALIALIGFQIFKQRIISGLIIAIIFILLNMYMVLALVSELSEFKSITEGFKIMLLVGGLYLGLNIIIGFFMLIKYLKKSNAKQLQKTIS